MYSLVAGTGDTGNAAFTIVANELRTALAFDFETQASYSIRVRTTDTSGLFKNKVFTISVTDVFDGPTIVSAKVNDGAAQRSKVDHLTITFSTAVTLPATSASAFALTGPDDNVNWVYGPGSRAQTVMPRWLYLVLVMILFPVVIYLPLHLLLSRLLGRV
jgi:hypothetical protein